MRDPPCPFCRAAPVDPAADALPDHVHCDGVVLLPESRPGRNETVAYRGAWSRGMNLWIVVSRPSARRSYWRAVLRERGALTNLVVADGGGPQCAAHDLEDSIDGLRGAFGQRRTRW